MKDKTPLHAVVSVICDCLADLSADDQARALEATRVTLGLRAPVAQTTRSPARGEALPLVQVEMESGQPMVISPPMPRAGRPIVVIGPQRQLARLNRIDTAARQPVRQLAAAQARAAVPGARGYVRAIR